MRCRSVKERSFTGLQNMAISRNGTGAEAEKKHTQEDDDGGSLNKHVWKLDNYIFTACVSLSPWIFVSSLISWQCQKYQIARYQSKLLLKAHCCHIYSKTVLKNWTQTKLDKQCHCFICLQFCLGLKSYVPEEYFW